MIIKLQPEGISSVWPLIRRGMALSYGIPKELENEFAVSTLQRLLTGATQCWAYYVDMPDGSKDIKLLITTYISNDNAYGVRALTIDSMYNVKDDHKMTVEVFREFFAPLLKYALANKCKLGLVHRVAGSSAEYLKEFGFKEHSTTYAIWTR